MQQALSVENFADTLRNDIANDRVQLPTLPEVALQVRDAVDNESANAQQVADIVTGDAALSARLIQVANSPLYAGRTSIDHVQMAVTRMGLKLVKSLVISLAMKQIFQATSDALDAAFRRVWEDSVEVAAISRVLAQQVDGLEPEQAMLAGLIHNIGCLPIITALDQQQGFEAHAQTIHDYCEELAPEVGCLILEHWGFTKNLARTPCECVQLDRNTPETDYADLVLVARLEHLMSKGRAPQGGSLEHWGQIPAFSKVGMETEVIVLEQAGPAEEIAEVRNMLSA